MTSEQAVVWGTGQSAQGPLWKVRLLMLAGGVLHARPGEKGKRVREEAAFVQEERSESRRRGDLREEEVWPGAPDQCLRCHRLLSQWTEKHLMWVLTLVLFLGLIPK